MTGHLTPHSMTPTAMERQRWQELYAWADERGLKLPRWALSSARAFAEGANFDDTVCHGVGNRAGQLSGLRTEGDELVHYGPSGPAPSGTVRKVIMSR